MTERISFFSPELHSNILPILNKFINECVNIKAVISFWALDHHLLDPSFLNKIKGHGFLCVDFHTPTNIDEICAIASHDTNVFLHLYKAAGKLKLMAHTACLNIFYTLKYFFLKCLMTP